MFFVWFCIRRYINRLETEFVKSKYGCFFEEYNTEGYGKWTTVMFLAIRYISVLGMVFGNSNAYIQVSCFLLVNVGSFAWTMTVRPHNNRAILIGAMFSDLVAVISNCIYFKLCEPGMSDLDVEALGDTIFYLYVAVSGINIGAGFVKSGQDLYAWWKSKPETTPEDSYAINKSDPTNSNVAVQPVDAEAPRVTNTNFLREEIRHDAWTQDDKLTTNQIKPENKATNNK